MLRLCALTPKTITIFSAQMLANTKQSLSQSRCNTFWPPTFESKVKCRGLRLFFRDQLYSIMSIMSFRQKLGKVNFKCLHMTRSITMSNEEQSRRNFDEKFDYRRDLQTRK